MSPFDFDDIRPYNNKEVKYALNSIASDPETPVFLNYLFPNEKPKRYLREFKKISSLNEFQAKFAYRAFNVMIDRTMESLTYSGIENIEKSKPYLFISNHRDIILDSALLNVVLFENLIETTQTAIGDNLLVSPMVTHFLKLNKSFVVKRSISPRAAYNYSKKLSAYIHHVINDLKSSVWIAQRQGRAKDGNDITQPGLLKMLCLHDENNFEASISSLHILPVAVSYEYDPCDTLKAQEIYCSLHDLPFEKTPEFNLESMLRGLQGFKGKVHVTYGKELDVFSLKLNEQSSINDKLKEIALAVDEKIHHQYKLWKTNYMAYDILYSTDIHEKHYTLFEKRYFEEQLKQKITTLPEMYDPEEIFSIILQQYANPLKNLMKYSKD